MAGPAAGAPGLRLGPAEVRLVPRAAAAWLQYDLTPDGLSLTSRCQFATLRADVAVASGRWAFEVTLRTGGIMQLGWCTAEADARVTHENGCGDYPDSYAYDGKRLRRWNAGYAPYGACGFVQVLGISV